MNRSFVWISLIALVTAASSSSAQTFTFHSGSDGSLGALNVTADTTLNMPPDGIFKYTTITVASGATLRFQGNVLNTPVYLLAQSDVDIEGTIDVSGSHSTPQLGGFGGPGGFQGGNARTPAGNPPGDGHGPGGGKGGDDGNDAGGAGLGSYGTVDPSGINNHAQDGKIYGSSALIPMIGGSGGGGAFSWGGGGGGGAILIASDTKINVAGAIHARGGGVGQPGFNVGSGGAIRLVSPVVTGSGLLDTNPGGRDGDGTFYGALGRIRVDTLQRTNLSLQMAGVAASGFLMVTFLPSAPQLDITSAAGTAIPVGTANPVIVVLPAGAPATQPIQVAGLNFQGMVPIVVALFPDSGPATFFNGTIDMTTATGTPPVATTTVNVTLPVNMATRIYVWNAVPPAATAARVLGKGGSTGRPAAGKTHAPVGKPVGARTSTP